MACLNTRKKIYKKQVLETTKNYIMDSTEEIHQIGKEMYRIYCGNIQMRFAYLEKKIDCIYKILCDGQDTYPMGTFEQEMHRKAREEFLKYSGQLF